MKWLYKLEYKYGRYALNNMILYILCAQLLVFLVDGMFAYNLSDLLMLDVGRAFGQWQLWRIITFIFVPTNYSPFWFIIGLFFYYFIGQSLERAWGAFMFNAYYIIGMLSTVLGAVIIYFITGYGYGTSEYLNMSMFFAFAILYPESPIRLFFLISIPAKYLAIISAVLMVVDIFVSVAGGYWYLAVSALMAMINLALFFWRDIRNRIQTRTKYNKTRQNYNNQMKQWENERRRNNDKNNDYRN